MRFTDAPDAAGFAGRGCVATGVKLGVFLRTILNPTEVPTRHESPRPGVTTKRFTGKFILPDLNVLPNPSTRPVDIAKSPRESRRVMTSLPVGS